MKTVLLGLAVFVSAGIVDFVWARYTLHLTARHTVRAANYAFAISCMGLVSFEAWLHNPLLVLPTAAGSWVGTYLTTKHTAR